jgi:hypothetical protein
MEMVALVTMRPIYLPNNEIYLLVYQQLRVERAKGIEPSCEAWKASVLPLNYARLRPAGRDFGAASPLHRSEPGRFVEP